MQLQKSFDRASGSRCRPALSVGRRRDLAFGSLAPPSHREGRREKRKREGLEGESVRGCRSRARSKRANSEIATAGRRWWFLLAPAARHEAEELRGEKRHQAMEGVSVCLFVGLLHGSSANADSATRPRFTRAPTRGEPQTNVACGSKARRRQRRQRLVRIESPTGEEPTADWTDPPKRGRRRENAGSSGRFGRDDTGSGNHRSKAGDRNVIPSGTVEHGCTRVE